MVSGGDKAWGRVCQTMETWPPPSISSCCCTVSTCWIGVLCLNTCFPHWTEPWGSAFVTSLSGIASGVHGDTQWVDIWISIVNVHFSIGIAHHPLMLRAHSHQENSWVALVPLCTHTPSESWTSREQGRRVCLLPSFPGGCLRENEIL